MKKAPIQPTVRTQIATILILLLSLVLAGCTSVEAYAAKRTDRLREIYPLRVTTRDDVQKKWGANLPDWSETRPKGGWANHKNRYLAETMPGVEKRAACEIARMERYSAVDGFMSLCYCWFYYDATDHLVDVQWMHQSD